MGVVVAVAVVVRMPDAFSVDMLPRGTEMDDEK